MNRPGHRPTLPLPQLFVRLRLLLLLILGGAGFSGAAADTAATSTPGPLRNREDFNRWMSALSNQGRWGADDELGALNLVTPAKRREAAALVRDGVSVSLSRDVPKAGADNPGAPFQYWMDRAGTNNPGFSAADSFRVAYHGFTVTHIDSLCHMFHDGRMYNGFAQTNVTGDGARRLGIGNLRAGIVTRGVLVDIPFLRGVPYLEPGTAILPADLDAWEKRSGLHIGAGDVVLIRTGRWAREAIHGSSGGTLAGLHGTCAAWLKARDVAVVGSDAAADVQPSGVEGVTMPLHLLSLVAMGTWILDNCDLESLGRAAQERQRWEFLLTVAPLAIPGGTGSPVNPLATF